MNMNSTKKNNSKEIPFMTLLDVFETLQAVGRGVQESPSWAGKKVYVGNNAKTYWENIESKDNCL